MVVRFQNEKERISKMKITQKNTKIPSAKELQEQIQNAKKNAESHEKNLKEREQYIQNLSFLRYDSERIRRLKESIVGLSWGDGASIEAIADFLIELKNSIEMRGGVLHIKEERVERLRAITEEELTEDFIDNVLPLEGKVLLETKEGQRAVLLSMEEFSLLDTTEKREMKVVLERLREKARILKSTKENLESTAISFLEDFNKIRTFLNVLGKNQQQLIQEIFYTSKTLEEIEGVAVSNGLTVQVESAREEGKKIPISCDNLTINNLMEQERKRFEEANKQMVIRGIVVFIVITLLCFSLGLCCAALLK